MTIAKSKCLWVGVCLATAFSIQSTPAHAKTRLSKSDKAALSAASRATASFLNKVQAAKPQILPAKGLYVARFQRNNKACQNLLLEANAHPASDMAASWIYAFGKYETVLSLLRQDAALYISDLDSASWGDGSRGSRVSASVASSIRGFSSILSGFFMLYHSYGQVSADNICSMLATWKADNWAENKTPKLIQETSESIGFMIGATTPSVWGRADDLLVNYLRSVKAPRNVLRFVQSADFGVSVLETDPIWHALENANNS